MSYKNEREQQDVKKIREKLTSLPDFMTGYIRSKAENTSTLTRLAYLSDIKSFFDYLVVSKKVTSLQNMKLKDLKSVLPNDIEGFLEYIGYRSENGRVRGCGRNAKARKISALNDLYNYAIRETRLIEAEKDRIIENPVNYINSVKIPELPIKTLKKEEAQSILDNISNGSRGMNDRQLAYNDHTRDRDTAIFLLFITTGMRLSELQALNLSDVDFAEKYIVVERGKRDKSRVVPLTEDAETALNYYLTRRNKKNPEEEGLFLSLQNKRMHVNTIRNVIKKYSDGKIACHTLRKTFGTILYRETGDIQLVADTLGHSNINTTRKHYAQSDIRKRLDIARNITIL